MSSHLYDWSVCSSAGTSSPTSGSGTGIGSKETGTSQTRSTNYSVWNSPSAYSSTSKDRALSLWKAREEKANVTSPCHFHLCLRHPGPFRARPRSACPDFQGPLASRALAVAGRVANGDPVSNIRGKYQGSLVSPRDARREPV